MCDCGSCLVKYILCIFNFIILISGIVILFSGVWLMVDKRSLIGLTNVVTAEQLEQFARPNLIDKSSYVLIAIGACMFIVSFTGYCGASRESQCLLTTYGLCLITLLILEVITICVAASFKDEMGTESKNILKKTISKHYSKPGPPDVVGLMWDQLQARLHCCGVDDYEDFKTALKWTPDNKVVPESCCVLEGNTTALKPSVPTCTTHPDETNSYYKRGCYQAVMNWIKTNANIILGALIGLGLVELKRDIYTGWFIWVEYFSGLSEVPAKKYFVGCVFLDRASRRNKSTGYSQMDESATKEDILKKHPIYQSILMTNN